MTKTISVCNISISYNFTEFHNWYNGIHGLLQKVKKTGHKMIKAEVIHF